MRWVGLALFLTGLASPVCAQTVGVRAEGMGGAFTGVADDASAVYWNPAGLASGAYFSGVADVNLLKTGVGTAGHEQTSGGLVAIAMPALGLSYYRTRTTTAAGFFVAHNFGATVDQSLWSGAAVGATVRLVHGASTTEHASFSGTKLDVDLGFMQTGSLGRIGITIRNLLAPRFGPDAETVGSVWLDRQVRVGGSLNLTDSTLIAADADLTTTALSGTDRRQAAVGVEQRLSTNATVRGGLRWNTRFRIPANPSNSLGLAPEGSVGASYAFYGRTSADAQVTFGSPNGDRGWGIGLRMAF